MPKKPLKKAPGRRSYETEPGVAGGHLVSRILEVLLQLITPRFVQVFLIISIVGFLSPLLFGLFGLLWVGEFAVVYFWALSSFGVGSLGGFIIGFPRTVGDARQPDGVPRQLPSKSLEEISDWLTKIIIGLSLVQFREFTVYFRECAREFAAGFKGGESLSANVTLAQGLIVYFTITGFFFAFLLTRLPLSVAIRRIDRLESTREMEVPGPKREDGAIPPIVVLHAKPIRRSEEGRPVDKA